MGLAAALDGDRCERPEKLRFRHRRRTRPGSLRQDTTLRAGRSRAPRGDPAWRPYARKNRRLRDHASLSWSRGLYAMGVVSKLRRRGIGTALVRAALGAAGAAGCHHVVLNATEDGARCYTACGFRSLGWGQTWWWSLEAAPSSRQVELAEAIGFGDLAAVDALMPSADELTHPLPCGETPLTLALLTQQPGIGIAILERCPELAACRYPPHGTTLLHLAIEYDRPRFVEIALAHGIDPVTRDASFGGTALDWAEHFRRDSLILRLRDL